MEENNIKDNSSLTGGIKEAKDYMYAKDIPQLFESMMTALMYKKPSNHLEFLSECLSKAKDNPVIEWSSFIEPLPPSLVKKKESCVTRKSSKVTEELFTKDAVPFLPIGSEDHTAWYAEYTNHHVDMSNLCGKPVIFVLGGPGCGKGTQCTKLVEKYGFKHLSAGDLLRNEVNKDSAISRKIDAIMKDGQLVPVDVTICLLKESMVKDNQCSGFLIDGFPREICQGTKFEKQVYPAKLVLYFDCADEVLIKRLLLRATHSGRADDNQATIEKRLALFHEKTAPVIDHYRNIIAKIPAGRDIEEVFADTCKSIDNLIQKPLIFVLGGPGSGKGTQCVKLAEKFNLAHFSTGDLLRAEAKSDTEVGCLIHQIMKEGQLVPKDIIIRLLRDAMQSVTGVNGYLVDGFPREYDQSVKFEQNVARASIVLFYHCADDILVTRLLARAKHSGRGDDNEETIKKRLELFHSKTAVLTEHFNDRLKTINSDQTVDNVFKDSCEALQEIFPEKKLVVNEESIVNVDEEIMEGTARRDHLLKDTFENKEVIFVVGGPGCGKGTQCSKIVEKFGYTHLSTGDLLRAEVERGTQRSARLKEIMTLGELVPQALILDILGDVMLSMDQSECFILDGFPREIDQAEQFERQITAPSMLLYFSCPTDVMIERLMERAKTSARADDNETTIRERIKTFETQTLPLVEKYSAKENNVVREIPALKTADEVFLEVCEVLEKHVKNKNMCEELAGKNIVFVLGGPGSGKGTQCAKIVEKYGFCHLSTGDLLREEVKTDSARAEQLKAVMAKGELVSQETILELLKDAMVKRKDCKGFLIDGFPRDISQGQQFESTVASCKFILYFECSNECMTERLLGRAKTSGRVDDNEATIKLRLKTFEDATLPVLGEFCDRLKKVNAERNVDDIFVDVCSAIDQL